MTTVPDIETHRRPLVSSEPAPPRNAPLLYGLGSFGLESAYKVFWGFYVFYYVDVLGLALLGVLFGYVSGAEPGPRPGNSFRFLIGAVPFAF